MNNNVTGVLLLYFLLKTTTSFAQQAENIYYFNKDGKKVNARDSAAYYRVIDSKEDSLFKFTEYRADGTWVKASAKGTIENPVYDGYVNLYYKNGNAAEKHLYSNGRATKTLRYHINGTLLQTIVYGYAPNIPYERIIYEADSAGNVGILNGKGTRTEKGILTQGMLVEHYTMTGPYLNGAKEGEWEGTNDWNIHFKEKYKRGRFISGKSNTTDGKSYKYDYALGFPIFYTGRSDFERWVSGHLLHPSDSINLSHVFRGLLQLNYLIDKKGRPTAINALKTDNLTEVPIALNRNPPKWAPATVRGVPVSYQMIYNNGSLDFNKDFVILTTSPVFLRYDGNQ